ncbi:unnamed protein product, partial [Meganyctiphanes norvegica]
MSFSYLAFTNCTGFNIWGGVISSVRDAIIGAMQNLQVFITKISLIATVYRPIGYCSISTYKSCSHISTKDKRNVCGRSDYATFIRRSLYLNSDLKVTNIEQCQAPQKGVTEMELQEGSGNNIKSQSLESESFTDIETWKFAENDLLKFPIDPVKENYVRRNVRNAVFSSVAPIPMKGTSLLAGFSSEALKLLDMQSEITSSSEFVNFASGSWIHPTSTPLAHRYGGHQFGYWADQLGDGRAHLLGHYYNSHTSSWVTQLKWGASRISYRSGNCQGILKLVREFLTFSGFYKLGFRTSRSASLVIGEDLALRDQFYNGNMKMENMAVVLRLSPTWFRFGSLEILTKKGESEILTQLVEHVITEHYPAIPAADPNRILLLFSTILEETAEMIAQWQSIGFTHGVMNTDNMSLMSVTIDYGPFGFLEAYNPDFIPNSSDEEGMYSYRNQPRVGFMNLARLSFALMPLLKEDQLKQMKTILDGYNDKFEEAYGQIFAKKMGFKKLLSDDHSLFENFLSLLKDSKADFNMAFWELGNISVKDLSQKKIPKDFWTLNKIISHDKFSSFMQEYEERLKSEEITEESRQSIMSKMNPRYILRNWIAQMVIENAEKGNYEDIATTLRILQNPFTIDKEAEDKGFGKPPPKWSDKIRVSCSS